MKRVVLDAGAFLDWFGADAPGRTLRAEYEAGALEVYAPRIFPLHVLQAAMRDGTWSEDRIARLATELDAIGFELLDPPARELAHWLARGLDANRAPYAALAGSLDLWLVAADAELLRRASPLARAVTDA